MLANLLLRHPTNSSRGKLTNHAVVKSLVLVSTALPSFTVLGDGCHLILLRLRALLGRRGASLARALELLAPPLLLVEDLLDGLALHGHLAALKLKELLLTDVGRGGGGAAAARDAVRVVADGVAGKEVVVG